MGHHVRYSFFRPAGRAVGSSSSFLHFDNSRNSSVSGSSGTVFMLDAFNDNFFKFGGNCMFKVSALYHPISNFFRSSGRAGNSLALVDLAMST